MRAAGALAVVAALAVSACGDDEPTAGEAGARTGTAPGTSSANATPDRPAPTGTRIVLGDSEFGRMLFDRRRQAIYVFEQDRRDRTACVGECARAWPPVFTRGRPRAGRGVRQALLGTIRRPGGRRQVTYAGRPLYFYAHERPGEVRCHNVDLHGGLWWVIGPDGRRRP